MTITSQETRKEVFLFLIICNFVLAKNVSPMPRKLVLVCLLNFLVAGLLGLALRYFFIQSLPINYRFLTHAHSHTAMLGWVYLMLFLLIVHQFIPDIKPIYYRLFWITQIAVLGMVLSFPFQGYAAISITFSSLHIFCSYYFVRLIWKNHRVKSKVIGHLLKASLLFMLLSTIGVWCLGPAAATLGQASAFFQIAIQFFLHFQFNGWFLLAVLALFLNQFDVEFNSLYKRFFWSLISGTILTFALPISWFAYHPILLWLNGLGVLLQLLALYYFIQLLKPHWNPFWSQISSLSKLMYRLALICFLLKIILQSSSILPAVAKMAYQYHNFVIGFIHLTMLGVVTGFLFSFLIQDKSLTAYNLNLRLAIYSFLIGFVGTEILLFGQGWFYYLDFGMVPHYYLLLFISSFFLPLGILLFILNILNHDSKTYQTT